MNRLPNVPPGLFLVLAGLCLLGAIPGQAAYPVLVLDAGQRDALAIEQDQVRSWSDVGRGKVRLGQDAPNHRPVIGQPLNGRPTLAFKGSQFLQGPPILSEGDDTFTYIALWRPKASRVQVIFEQAGSGDGRRASLLQVGDAYGFNGQGNDAHQLVKVQPGQWHLTGMVINGWEKDNVIVVHNGEAPIRGTIDIDRLNIGRSGTRIGNKLTSNSEWFEGEIAEIQVFNSALGMEELNRHLAGIQTRWGLTLSGGQIKAPEIPSVPELSKAGQIEFFETHVRPVLATQCYECHSTRAKKLKAALYLDSREGILKGSESGPVVVPGEPDKSLLIQAVRYQVEDLEMPPDKKLSDKEVKHLSDWISMGLPWPEGDTSGPLVTGPAYDWDKFRKEHWAFRPVEDPPLPEVRDTARVQNPIDQFILADLDRHELAPVPAADRRTLIRRAHLVLIGLPPEPEKVEAFVADPDPNAFDRVIDDLLQSKHYGERWGRHWLDVARYSDGMGGFLDNKSLPNAWRYRDWVVEALNQDMPYDAFVRAQIAGDLISGHEGRVATGFFAVGPTYISDGGDPEAKSQAQAETLGDRIDTFSRAFLGLTAACARCHDHKFDPIAATDYYALAGIFNNARVVDAPAVPQEIVDTYNKGQEAIKAQDNKIKEYLKRRAEAKKVPEKESEKNLLPEEKHHLEGLKAERERLKKEAPPDYAKCHSLQDSGSGDMHVAIRGDLRKKGEKVPRRFLQIFAGENPQAYEKGSGREELAHDVTNPENPLTARVMVNRIWLSHFGQGLVGSPSNFGVIGEKPSHPELLDWLARRFVESGWSIKAMHRLIMSSATWQRSSRFDQVNFNRDGGNTWYWRFAPRKLDVEAWRDTVLDVSGQLDRTVGGAPTDKILETRRRTLYAKISRNGDRFRSDEFLRLFDFPSPRATSPMRTASTVPQQYLFMLNSPFLIRSAKALAERVTEVSGQDQDRIMRMYALLYSRPPTPEETDLGLAFLNRKTDTQTDPDTDPALSRWHRYAQVLLSAHELMQIQ